MPGQRVNPGVTRRVNPSVKRVKAAVSRVALYGKKDLSLASGSKGLMGRKQKGQRNKMARLIKTNRKSTGYGGSASTRGLTGR